MSASAPSINISATGGHEPHLLLYVDIIWETRVGWFKSNLLQSSQMYNMLSLHKYN